jgi:hypothetical protein
LEGVINGKYYTINYESKKSPKEPPNIDCSGLVDVINKSIKEKKLTKTCGFSNLQGFPNK